MADLVELSDPDFDAQMQGLVQEAQQALVSKGAAAEPEAPAARPLKLEGAPTSVPEIPSAPGLAASSSGPAQSVAEMLRPVVLGVQAVGRATGEQTQILSKIEGHIASVTEAQKELPEIVAELRALTEQRQTVSRAMFDALYTELKDYKDGFLMEAVHKPIIQDLISQHDGMLQIFSQMCELNAEADLPTGDPVPISIAHRFAQMRQHMEHHIDFILEVLARLEVQRMPLGAGKLDMRTQRAVLVEAAATPEEDMAVVRTLKRGFWWKERVVRPEEVVVRRWRDAFSVAQPETSV